MLSLMIFLPLLAAAVCLFVSANVARWTALATTFVLFALGCGLWANYEVGGPQWQFTEYAPVFGRFAWALGIDGIALMLIMLSVFRSASARRGTASRHGSANIWQRSC